MTANVDLATVLLLHKSSFLVGALCFLYVRWHSPHNRDLGFLAAGFLLLAIASTVAGMGEQRSLPLPVWTMASFASGVFGYALFWIGVKRLSSRSARPADWAALLVPVSLVAGAAFTGLHLHDAVRGTMFNVDALIFLSASVVTILADSKHERLPARFALSASLTIASLLSVSVITGLNGIQLLWLDTRNAFFLLIMCHFAVALFTFAFIKERAEAELTRLAETDALTGIGNRRWFFSKLPAVLHPGDAIVMIDIDRFKLVNDSLGHEAGDMALKAVANEIARHLQPQDVFGRLGGEEFVIFLRGRTRATLLATTERIRIGVRLLAVDHAGEKIPLSISAGIAVRLAGERIEDLLRDADHALYDAKNRGRNQVALSSDPSASILPLVKASA